MPRPFKCRVISANPSVSYFKPQGIPMSQLQEVNLTRDELEAVRLADEQGLYQTEAAKVMHVSRQTFGNIINSAHHKIAQALLTGKALRISGGAVRIKMSGQRFSGCRRRRARAGKACQHAGQGDS